MRSSSSKQGMHAFKAFPLGGRPCRSCDRGATTMGAASSTLALLNSTGARPPAPSKASAANAGRARPVNPSVLETGIGWARMLRPSAQVCLPGAYLTEILCWLPEAVLTLFCDMPSYDLQRPVAQRVLGEDRSSTAATGPSPSKALVTVCLREEVA